jgi:hypothetical protein
LGELILKVTTFFEVVSQMKLYIFYIDKIIRRLKVLNQNTYIFFVENDTSWLKGAGPYEQGRIQSLGQPGPWHPLNP